MPWECHPAKDAFDSFASRWDAINRSRHNHVLLDSRFIRPLLKHFASDDVVLIANENSFHPCMALVHRKSFGVWETFQPSQAPLGLLLLGYADPAGESLIDVMRHVPGLCFQFAAMQQDTDFSGLPTAPPDPRFQTMTYAPTGRLRLQGSFEEYWQTRSKDLRDNLARRQRRLQKEGRPPGLVVHRDPAAMAACLREYGRMESAGWKAQEGTAIAEDNSQGHFYREVLEVFAETGEAFVYELHLDGNVIGSELYIGRGEMLVGLKTTYDESFKTISPGFLMKYEILRALFSEGIFHNVEFYGRVMEWHNKWITEVRDMYHLSVFRNRSAARLRAMLKRFV